MHQKPKPKVMNPKKPKPNFFDDDERSVKRKSLDNEKRLAAEIGFTCTPGSGNTPWPGVKGDGEHPLFMFECKETKHASIRIAGRDVQTLVDNARLIGKAPVLVVSAYKLPEAIPKDWVAVPAETFRWILEKLENLGEIS